MYRKLGEYSTLDVHYTPFAGFTLYTWQVLNTQRVQSRSAWSCQTRRLEMWLAIHGPKYGNPLTEPALTTSHTIKVHACGLPSFDSHGLLACSKACNQRQRHLPPQYLKPPSLLTCSTRTTLLPLSEKTYTTRHIVYPLPETIAQHLHETPSKCPLVV